MKISYRLVAVLLLALTLCSCDVSQNSDNGFSETKAENESAETVNSEETQSTERLWTNSY